MIRKVSTHSRAEAAATINSQRRTAGLVSTHSHAKAAAGRWQSCRDPSSSFNTQPLNRWYVGDRWFQHTAAQRRLRLLFFHRRPLDGVSTHSRPKAAAQQNQAVELTQHTAARRRLRDTYGIKKACDGFQHTAARRRLRAIKEGFMNTLAVSTHSRTKAAAFSCFLHKKVSCKFQHTAARRRLQTYLMIL